MIGEISRWATDLYGPMGLLFSDMSRGKLIVFSLPLVVVVILIVLLTIRGMRCHRCSKALAMRKTGFREADRIRVRCRFCGDERWVMDSSSSGGGSGFGGAGSNSGGGE